MYFKFWCRWCYLYRFQL